MHGDSNYPIEKNDFLFFIFMQPNSLTKSRQKWRFSTSSKISKDLKVKLGQTFSLKINSLGPKKMGLVEFHNLTILVPNANLGDLVKVKLEKILPTQSKLMVLGSLIQVIQKGKISIPLEVGQKIDLTIKKKGPKNSGLGFFENDFPIMVPNMKFQSVCNVQVKITKIKANYAFASVVSTDLAQRDGLALSESNREKTKAFLSKIEQRNCYKIILPLNAISIGNFLAFKLNGTFLFIQKNLGIKGGDHVLLKLLRIRENFSIGKVVKVGQSNTAEQNKKVKTILKKMILSSMHYGERAIKCNANMRSYLWLRKKGKNQNRPLLKRGRHILNLFKTYKSFKKSLLQLSKYAANGQTFLFVGTKKSASAILARTAVLSQTSFFVNNRWLGGMLTNWKTILKSLSQMKPILKEKQKVVQNLLFSRQKIKDRLLAKGNSLRKFSRKFMVKGKKFVTDLQQNPNRFIDSIEFLLTQKKNLLTQNKNYIEKYVILSTKEQKTLSLLSSLKSHFQVLLKQKGYLKNQISNMKKEVSELKQLFLMGQKISTTIDSMLASGKTIWSVQYSSQSNIPSDGKLLPNPSVEILNQIISIYNIKKTNFVFNGNESKSVQPIILSKLLQKFLVYLPFIKKYLLLTYQRLITKEKNLNQLNHSLESIQKTFQSYETKALNYKKGLETLKSKLFIQQNYLKALKIQLLQLSSEQRLLKFVPKLRYLPTTKTKMYSSIELLMKKFVDPKMSYVIDQIYDQKLQYTSKKMANIRKQKSQRLEKYFGGITQMSKISTKQISDNVAIIIGQQEEMNAVRECQKLGIKMFTIVDTNCNPNLSDYIIPANDDSSTSMEYILEQMLTYIRLAQKLKRKLK